MNSELVIEIATHAVNTILRIGLPLMLVALVVGLLVSIFQATTQIQEQTLAFIPKIIAVLVAVLFFGRWMLGVMVDFTYNLLDNLYNFIG
ncbi:flagellar biosynthesis protein FliQ [Longirhabdus pacifica]|uniref:flagellar biosynthesis protein FliQ n=1 Tax=Longirhabdus pacifica TaxID=2305227 RepID=UPI001008A5AD|nr:flagellar biosynthesis protein FliQ [Longirhabdus pacifica]